MDFTFTAEQEALREQAREFLQATPEPSWAQLAELGWTGISIPEAEGGAGLTFLEEAIVLEELARALVHSPYFSTVVLALPALPSDLRAQVAAGEATWTVALGPLVSDLDAAERVAVAGGDGVYELEGFEREVLATVDPTRPLGVVRGGEVGRRLADAVVLGEIRTRALAGLAIEACGVARRALEYGLEHACTREQFGKKIGVYQAVSHALVNAYTRLELARSLALWAAWCVATDDREARLAAAAAKAAAAEAAVGVCETSMQTLGGIGFTWEHDLHRLYKRALWIESFVASGNGLRAEIAAALLDAPGATQHEGGQVSSVASAQRTGPDPAVVAAQRPGPDPAREGG